MNYGKWKLNEKHFRLLEAYNRVMRFTLLCAREGVVVVGVVRVGRVGGVGLRWRLRIVMRVKEMGR
jgi:hypothetical protein